MDHELESRWQRITETCAASPQLDPAARSALLDEACVGDPGLRVHIERLLDNYSSAQEFFARGPDRIADSGSRNPTRTFSDGEIVSERFRIVGLLGEGGMGEVYEAEDLFLPHERIALKTLRASVAADEGAMERFGHELRLARKITHPNVCRVHDVYLHQTASGARSLFFTMELLEGDTLADRLRSGPITTTNALPVVRQMAAAIDAAHLAHVAHGDFKPGNVMLVAGERGGERVVVTDFGLARWLPVGSALLSVTGESGRWGTPAYMAPEQLFGGGITRATDIYALGVVLYEMVTGHHPFTVGNPLLLALRKLRHAPRPPREYLNDLDPRWQNAIVRCLDVDPEKRFEFAADVIQELEREPKARKWWIAGAAVVSGAALLGIPPVREMVAETSAPISTALARYFGTERTVALLPFSQEGTTDVDAFSLGLTAAVTDQLGTLSRDQHKLYVVPAEQVIDTGVDTAALVRQNLGANLIVTGRLAVGNNRTQVTITLNEMSGDGFASKDSKTVEIRPGDHELLQTTVAAAILQLLRVRPRPVASHNPGGEPRRSEAEKSYLLGRGYLLQGPGGLTLAIAAFHQAIQENDQSAPAYTGLSEAYLDHYDATRDVQSLKNAESKIDEAITLNPGDARAHVIRGRWCLATGQAKLAILEFGKALAIDPNNAVARSQRAAAYQADGAIEMAEHEYRTAIALHPRYWSGYEDLGTFLYRQGRYRDAEQNYVTGITYAPANRRAIANLAAVYEIQERFLAAETVLIKGLKLSPDAILYNNLGWIYILDGKLEDAVNAMKQAVSLPKADSVVWSSLARAYRWAGKHEEAERAAYKRALEMADDDVRVNPLNPDIRANRAYLLAETDDKRQARREIEAALASENARGRVSVLFRSALVYEWVGERKRALEALEQASRGGYPLSRIARDPDLKELRNDPGYQRILDVARPGAPNTHINRGHNEQETITNQGPVG